MSKSNERPHVTELVVNKDEPSPDHLLFEAIATGGKVECPSCGPGPRIDVDITGDLMCTACKSYVPTPGHTDL